MKSRKEEEEKEFKVIADIDNMWAAERHGG